MLQFLLIVLIIKFRLKHSQGKWECFYIFAYLPFKRTSDPGHIHCRLNEVLAFPILSEYSF